MRHAIVLAVLAAMLALPDAALAQPKLGVQRKGPPPPPKHELATIRSKSPYRWKESDPVLLYRSKLWVHLGDNNFGYSDNWAKLKLKSVGMILRLQILISKKSKAEADKGLWKTIYFIGKTIGNDTGKLGKTSPTTVHIDDKKVGEITKSGVFYIQLPKALIAKKRKDRYFTIVIKTGQNIDKNYDDQEMGKFQLLLSKKPMPPKTKEKPPITKTDKTEKTENPKDEKKKDEKKK